MEYFQFLNDSLASAGESVSGLHAYVRSEQISGEQFELLDSLAYKIEKGMKKLIESLQHKQKSNDWEDSFVKESNVQYLAGRESEESCNLPTFHSSNV